MIFFKHNIFQTVRIIVTECNCHYTATGCRTARIHRISRHSYIVNIRSRSIPILTGKNPQHFIMAILVHRIIKDFYIFRTVTVKVHHSDTCPAFYAAVISQNTIFYSRIFYSGIHCHVCILPVQSRVIVLNVLVYINLAIFYCYIITIHKHKLAIITSRLCFTSFDTHAVHHHIF